MKKLASALIIMSLLMAGTALAAGNSAAHNGTQTSKQHKGKARAKFENCDKDNSGSLNWDEAHACFPRMTKEKFDAIDANKDGVLTKEEIKAYRGAHQKSRKLRQ